ERQDSRTVTHQQQALAISVPERERELAVQLLDEAIAELLVQMDDDLGIGARIEAVPLGFERAAQLDVIEDFAVVDDPDRLVLVVDRLRAAFEIDDAEPGVAEANA